MKVKFGGILEIMFYKSGPVNVKSLIIIILAGSEELFLMTSEERRQIRS